MPWLMEGDQDKINETVQSISNIFKVEEDTDEQKVKPANIKTAMWPWL